MHNNALGALEERLGHQFSDRGILTTALTHSSFSVENQDAPSYERLEFLGDAILEFVITEFIFETMDDADEGSMTKLRASVVDATTLGDIGRSLGLGDVLRLGVGERRSGGAAKDSLLSDAVEAVLGAMFIDGGIDPVRSLVRSVWGPRVVTNAAASATTDARSQLQEFLAETNRVVSFLYTRSGPDHEARFTAEACVDGHVIGTGSAGSKKTAAIEASRDALGSMETSTEAT